MILGLYRLELPACVVFCFGRELANNYRRVANKIFFGLINIELAIKSSGLTNIRFRLANKCTGVANMDEQVANKYSGDVLQAYFQMI